MEIRTLFKQITTFLILRCLKRMVGFSETSCTYNAEYNDVSVINNRNENI